MEKIHYLLTKAGPRLLDIMVDSSQMDIVVTAPGMLCQKLELVTNLSVLEGCDAGFYTELAADMEATAFCGHQEPLAIDINVDTHRLGAELSVEFGTPSMYQSLLRLRTRSGRTFKEAIMASRGIATEQTMMAGFYVVKAEGHMEHHASASKHLRDHAEMNHETMNHDAHAHGGK